MCTNNDRCVEESLYYINRLDIPEGYNIDCITVRDALSMTAGYNAAMKAADAKYKIYMHQDVLIIQKDFLFRILKIFEDKDIGMIGMVGARKIPENAIMWYGDRVGKIYRCNIYDMTENIIGNMDDELTQVQAIDGLLMATQYDVPWREDIFDGWDFYDVSQSFEFMRAGYKIVVPKMERPWCLHDDDLLNYRNYFNYRRLFLKEYSDNMKHYAERE